MPKSRYSHMMKDLLQNMFEGFVLDENQKLKVVNEDSAKKSADIIHKIVLEKSRELWETFENAEASLRSAAAEINFEELNADVSNMGRQEAGEVSIEDLTNMDQAQTLESTESLKKVLGTDDFDLSSIFESLDHLDSDDADGDGGDRHLTDEGEGMMMDAEDDELDGDDEFTKLQVGGDEEGMGADVGDNDMMPDEYGDEENGEEVEIEPENGEMDDELDEPMGDEGELDLGDEPMGGEEGALDFDFDSLGDLGGEEDEMEEMMGGYMESEGDDDNDDDKKDDDDDDDDKDDKDDDKPAFLKDKDED